MTLKSRLHTRWAEPWRQLGAPARTGLLSELLDRYSEAQRAYHTAQHLEECFGWFDRVRSRCLRPAEVELALWFHDAVYDPRRTDNEERSAAWVQRELAAAALGDAVAGRVRDLVLATAHGAIPDELDACLLVDVDLSILAADRGRFAEYETQVRQEYAWVDDAAFAAGRSRVLRGFLERPSVYLTEWFREKLETTARRNLTRALARWEQA
ncbi:MAG: N-methyl-D-aspartate receptor NMDAR2C subunit [Methylococcaceae bacterium]|nr:N-methyl-D-aspartate receptor NMDAR2C subunit [Methylococcaceae bacterium]